MPTAPAFTQIDYHNIGGITDDSSSRSTYKCKWADFIDVRNWFIGAADGDDANLMFVRGAMDPLGGDPGNMTSQVTMEAIPAWKANMLLNPYTIQYAWTDVGEEAFTVNGGYKWSNNQPVINNEVKPVRSFGVQNIRIRFSNPSVTGATYAGYRDMVNSGTWHGFADSCVRFIEAKISPRQLANGAITNDVEVLLKARSFDWNLFYNEYPLSTDATPWQTIKRIDTGALMFPKTSFSAFNPINL